MANGGYTSSRAITAININGGWRQRINGEIKQRQ